MLLASFDKSLDNNQELAYTNRVELAKTNWRVQ